MNAYVKMDEQYVSMTTEVKVGTKPVLAADGTNSKDKDGKAVTEAVKEAISFVVPKVDFFADIINEEITPATEKDEACYSNAKAQWLFEAITSKARSILTSRIEVKDGKLAYKPPYSAWTNFEEMIKVLGQRGRIGKDALIAAFVTDFTAYLLTLGKSEKYVSQRILLARDRDQLAAVSPESKEKFATTLGEFFSTLDDAGRIRHESVFGDLMAICKPKFVPELSDE